MPLIVALLVLALTLASPAAAADPYAGMKTQRGDTHNHTGLASNLFAVHNYYTVTLEAGAGGGPTCTSTGSGQQFTYTAGNAGIVGECVSNTELKAAFEAPAGLDNAEINDVESGGSVIGKITAGSAVQISYTDWYCDGVDNLPPDGVAHSFGSPLAHCQWRAELGYDFLVNSTHSEKYCLSSSCTVDGFGPVILTSWWTSGSLKTVAGSMWPADPASGWANGGTQGLVWAENCGFRDFADPGSCVSDAYDEMASFGTAAEVGSVGGFICLSGNEINLGSTTGAKGTACDDANTAGDPSRGAVRFQTGHQNIIYPSGTGSDFSGHPHCVAESSAGADADRCDDEDMYDEATALNTALTKNHNGFNAGDNYEECGCDSWTGAGGCAASFHQRQHKAREGGFDDRATSLVEVHGTQSSTFAGVKDWYDSVMLYWNKGFAPGVTYGSDLHGKCNALEWTPLEGYNAVVAWADGTTEEALIGALRNRRTYVIGGFDPTADAEMEIRFWTDDAGDTTMMGGFVDTEAATVGLNVTVTQDAGLVAGDAGRQMDKVQVLRIKPTDNSTIDWMDPASVATLSAAQLTGTVVQECDLDDAGAGNCANCGSENTETCSIAISDYLTSSGPTWIEVVNDDGHRDAMTSAIWINRCDFIEARETDVLCAGNGGMSYSEANP